MKNEFQSPSSAFRGKPFWSWNSKLEKNELLRQIRVLKEMGMGGFFMHSRTGLATEYLGKEWLKLVETCAQEAEKLGMEAWLYDEDRWPSGAAGGIVTRDSKYRMRYLRCTVTEAKDFSWPAKKDFVAAFVGELGPYKDEREGITLKSYRALPRTAGKPTLKPGEKILLFTVEQVQPHEFFNGSTYLNTLDPDAVRKFIQVTHERYKKSSGRRFGKTIPGIFTDEPHHGFVMCDTSKGWVYPVDSGWATPWTEGFPAHFKKKFGYDFITRAPELFFRLDGERFSPVKWQYMEALHSLFLKAWATPIGEWCRKNRLLYTGHILSEDFPGAISITNGSPLRYYEQMGAPGMDNLNTDDCALWTVKQVASAARQFGRKWRLSELYGCTGWQMGFDGHKEIGDWQAFLGINIRCHHLAWYSMAGESKRDYPASISFQSGWHRQYRAVEDYFSRVNLLMQKGEAACDILVLHPVESVWAQVFARWAIWIKNQSPDIAPIDENFKKICRWILGAQLDFDYGDEEQLARLGKLEKKEGQARLRLGRGSYRAILVGGLETMRSTTLEKLRKFQQAGGKVIFAGKPPGYVDALKSAEPEAFSRKTVRVPLERAPLVKALGAAAPPKVEVENVSNSNEERPVLLQVRKDGSAWLVALCNTDPAREYPSVKITFHGKGAQVQEWNCRNGERYAQPHKAGKGTLTWTTSLGKIGERVFRVVPVAEAKLKSAPVHREGVMRKISGPFAYELNEPNGLPIDQFEWRTGSGKWQSSMDVLVIDNHIRDQAGISRRTGAMVQPWARKKTKPKTLPIQLRTSFTVRALPEGPVHLLMEQISQWKIKLNGKPVSTVRDDGWFIDPCFRKVELPAKSLKTGENVLEFSTTFRQELDIEAIYLLGDFGIYDAGTKTPVIDRLPATLHLGDVCMQGLPFYTGRIRYQVPVPVGARVLSLPSFGGAVVTIRNGSDKESILAFPPYATELEAGPGGMLSLDVHLTRRNLFGPLHIVPKELSHTGPSQFRSVVGPFFEGTRDKPGYSVIPQLYPSGLLKAPEFEIAK